MFKPNFRYSHNMVGSLARIAAAREVSLQAVKERVVRLSSERLRKDVMGQVALTERQMRIVEHLNQSGRIPVGDVADMFKVTRQAALKEMGKLVKVGVVNLVGEGPGAHYVLE